MILCTLDSNEQEATLLHTQRKTALIQATVESMESTDASRGAGGGSGHKTQESGIAVPRFAFRLERRESQAQGGVWERVQVMVKDSFTRWTCGSGFSLVRLIGGIGDCKSCVYASQSMLLGTNEYRGTGETDTAYGLCVACCLLLRCRVCYVTNR